MSVLVKLIPCDSRSELQERLRVAPWMLLVGADAESPRGFYLLEPEIGEPICVGLCVANQAPLPQAASLGTVVLIGHDQSLTWIDVRAGKISARHHLEGVFYDFVQQEDEEIIIVHELGALKAGPDGAVFWTVVTSDVVEGFHIKDARVLKIDVMGSTPLQVSLTDGRKL